MSTHAFDGPVLLDIDHGVATLTLNRPDTANSVDIQTAVALGTAVDHAANDPDVRAVVLLGAGPRFCAGGDVGAMAAVDDRAGFIEELATTLDAALQRLESMAKPVVVGVQGAVAGAGLAVMLGGDIVVAAGDTRFTTAYMGLGLTPDCGLSWSLPRAIGQQRALELLLTPRVLTADEAMRWGLVTEVVSDTGVAARATELARGMADGPAHALGQARRLVRGAWERGRSATGIDEAHTIAAAVLRPEAERRMRQFAHRSQGRTTP